MIITLAFEHEIDKDKPLLTRLAAKGVQIWTKSKYYHVEIIIDGIWYSSRTDHGLRPLKLKPLSKAYDYYTIDTEISNKSLCNFKRFVKSNENTGYDWLGILLAQFLPFTIDNKDKWFCSEVVTKILQILDVYEVIDVEPHRISPEDLYRLVQKISTKIEV